MEKRLAVVGASGFVGQAVREAAASAGYAVKPVRLRVQDPHGAAGTSHPGDWHRRFSSAYQTLLHAFEDVDAVVNSAGVADPQAATSPSLRAANVVLPALIARAVHVTGVGRFLHVSSAAVQGRRDPLDEQAAWQPFSPYSQSKADAEKLLLSGEWAPPDQAQPPNIVLYRATSIHGPDRPLTRTLAHVANGPLVPVCRRGDVPLPVALRHNLGAGVVHAVATQNLNGIALQPAEGITAAQLWRVFNPNVRLLNLPVTLGRLGLSAMRSFGTLHPKADAMARRLELLLLGQSVHAEKLPASGFRVPDPMPAWRQLALTMAPSRESLHS